MAKPHEYPTLVPYLMTFLVSWVGAVGVILLVGNADLFLALNQRGNFITDIGFGVLTYLGDGGVFIGGAVLVLLLDYMKRNSQSRRGFVGYEGTAWWRRGVALVTGFLISGLVTQILKRLFFADWSRPATFFQSKGIDIRHPAWQELHKMGSFPSGHTLTAFCMACMLAFFFPYPRLQVALLALAWLVALSRIMVGQHFPLDIAAGAALGTAIALGTRTVFFPHRPIFLTNLPRQEAT